MSDETERDRKRFGGDGALDDDIRDVKGRWKNKHKASLDGWWTR